MCNMHQMASEAETNRCMTEVSQARDVCGNRAVFLLTQAADVYGNVHMAVLGTVVHGLAEGP